jgi:hypothetical protein
MPRGLGKPFLRWQSYSYNIYNISENFFVVESDKQVKAYLKSRSPEDFIAWIKDIRAASKNDDPIDSMVTYQYFSDGMDKPYKNDITSKLVTALPEENAKYKENLYYLLSNYNRSSNWHWCREINELKDSSLEPEWKSKFLALCTISGGKSKSRKIRNNRKGKNSRKSRK